MVYIVAPLRDVKGENSFAPYVDVLKAVEERAIERAKEIWPGYEAGGILPGAQQFGVGPLRKNDMAGDTSDSAASGSYSFANTVTTTGWADLFNYNIRDSEVHGFAGFIILEPTQHIWQLRLQVGDRRFPIWDISVAREFESHAFVLKEDEGGELIAAPGESVLIRGYWGTTGTNTVIPVGLNLFRDLSRMLDET